MRYLDPLGNLKPAMRKPKSSSRALRRASPRSFGNPVILPLSPKVYTTWTPKVGRIMAFWAVVRGLGPFFHILWGSRYILVFFQGLPNSLVSTLPALNLPDISPKSPLKGPPIYRNSHIQRLDRARTWHYVPFKGAL